MSSYTIIADGNARDEILRAEGICPGCGGKNTEYVEDKYERYRLRPATRFHYRCRDCKTQWAGEFYSPDYTKCLSAR